MFEKEAKEYVNEEYDFCYYPDDNLSTRINAERDWQNGAEFGYKEGIKTLDDMTRAFNREHKKYTDLRIANEWHKPSKKLPEECSLVLAFLFEETEPTMCKYVVSNQWECLPERNVFCSNDQVRLWKEIVLPELKESE